MTREDNVVYLFEAGVGCMVCLCESLGATASGVMLVVCPETLAGARENLCASHASMADDYDAALEDEDA